MKPRTFVIDVDGVMTTGQILYSSEGKAYKIFGPDDHDILNILRDKIDIFFITADKRGYPISKKRIVDEMKFDLHLVHPARRLEWFRKHVDLKTTVYMGDGALDTEIFKEVGYAICPQNGFYKAKQTAHYVTRHNGGDRSVAEACIHLLEKFFGDTQFTFNDEYGVWGKKRNCGKKSMRGRRLIKSRA